MHRRLTSVAASTTAVAIAVALLAAFAWVAFDVPPSQPSAPVLEATLVRVVSESTEASPRGPMQRRTVEVRVRDRVIAVEQTTLLDEPALVPPTAGDRVLVQETAGPSGPTYFIVDHERSGVLLWFAAAFAAIVVVVGRWHGVRSLLALAATFVVLMTFVLPGILSGRDPLLISFIGGVTILGSTLILAHGVTRKSAAAIAGTAAALVLIVALSQLAIVLAQFTGLPDEESATVFIRFGGAIDARGLFLSGILIGALGALDDVTMTQSSTVFELRDASPGLSGWDTYRRAMRVGRDHIASIVNTLVLAYAGASLPLLVLLTAQAEGASTLLSREFLAAEVIRTLVGSLGIVAAVPLTTALACWIGVSAGGDHPPAFVDEAG